MSAGFLEIRNLGMTFRGAEGALEVLRDITFDLGTPRSFCACWDPPAAARARCCVSSPGCWSRLPGASFLAAVKASPRVGLVFQHANLMPWRTVRQNIALPLELREVAPDEVTRRVADMMRLVGLEEFGNSWPSELSGGMAQRVAIARAFIQEPDLLLLDEPFGALDALTRERMGGELLRIWQAQRTPVIMVTHSITEALLLSDRVLLFSERPGQVIKDIPVTFTRPRKEELRYTAEFQRFERSLRGSLQQNVN